METCKAIVQEGIRKGERCQFPPGPESYCGRHLRNKEYDDGVAQGKTWCRFFFRGCNNEAKGSCDDCKKKLSKKIIECKHEGCKYKVLEGDLCNLSKVSVIVSTNKELEQKKNYIKILESKLNKKSELYKKDLSDIDIKLTNTNCNNSNAGIAGVRSTKATADNANLAISLKLTSEKDLIPADIPVNVFLIPSPAPPAFPPASDVFSAVSFTLSPPPNKEALPSLLNNFLVLRADSLILPPIPEKALAIAGSLDNAINPNTLYNTIL